MNKLSSITKQRGVVLVISLVFLVALTAVAAAMMQNSTTDMKMSGASEEQVVALQAVVSAVDEIIFNQIGPGQVNLFARPVKGPDNFPIDDKADTLPGSKLEATGQVDVANNQYSLDIYCPHLKLASSTDVFSCNLLRVTTQVTYGRNNLSSLTADSGIAQQLLK